MSEIAERLGVSRQAVYDWKERHRLDPTTGLNDRSRRPHVSPTQTAEPIERRLIEERKRWGFGSKKILRRLQDEEPEVAWPPRSTIDAIFKRAGLVRGRKAVRRRFASVRARHSYESAAAGEVMTADYKGHFRLRNGRYCYPLLVADPVSRYLLACDAYMEISLEQTWATLVRVFEQHGMPNKVHTDNGVPFGTSGHGRFSTIAARLMKYGIQPVYSRPGHPEDNGRHERLNKTLLEHTAIDPAHDRAGAQVGFDEFRSMYNKERPQSAAEETRPTTYASQTSTALRSIALFEFQETSRIVRQLRKHVSAMQARIAKFPSRRPQDQRDPGIAAFRGHSTYGQTRMVRNSNSGIRAPGLPSTTRSRCTVGSGDDGFMEERHIHDSVGIGY